MKWPDNLTGAAREAVILCGLALIPALMMGLIGKPVWKQLDRRSEISIQEVRRVQEKILWVDARSRDQFQEEHIPGAVLLNESEWSALLPGFLERWSPDIKVVVYCGGKDCQSSHQVVKRLEREGEITNAVVLKGGWSEWKTTPNR